MSISCMFAKLVGKCLKIGKNGAFLHLPFLILLLTSLSCGKEPRSTSSTRIKVNMKVNVTLDLESLQPLLLDQCLQDYLEEPRALECVDDKIKGILEYIEFVKSNNKP